ncbi:hypothetical protein B0H17DRAFT_1205880 [Mycena rosella]|uniref:Uncharacterized protein n=1 Tax=Mycena rosella TaxID=1033263 RepID=A0AAD7GDH5_MYCRO|nr:hypothetical protein B0H17DRAFT_1205880 [Mycena rosella]
MKHSSPLLSSAASISSFQSFDTIRKAPSTAATSVACSDAHRWSEVVPPESGLTFAVVWDPEAKDILTFSSAELSESSDRDPQSPDSPSDAYSQILTINPSIGPASEYTATATLEFFRENHDFLFGESTFSPDRPTRGRTQTSSTIDGLDVYLRGSMLGCAHNANRYYSCFQDLDADFAFDPRTSFAKWMKNLKREARDDVSDEGFFEGGQYNMDEDDDVNMSSSFSVTTTSTSNYINVENEMDDDESSDWSALEAPNTPGFSRLLFIPPPPPASRRLRKTRPVPGPAAPSAVLDRREYSHNVPIPPMPPRTPEASHIRPPSRSSTPILPRKLSMPKFARGIGKWKKTDTAGWVWIDVKGEAHSP